MSLSQVRSGTSSTAAPERMQQTLQCTFQPTRFMRRPPPGPAVPSLLRMGVAYPTKGEQHVKVETENGCLCGINFNDAPVTDPILSVSQLNDSGHDVMYRKTGGYIEHIKTGQRVKMYRREGVYWVKLKVLPPKGR